MKRFIVFLASFVFCLLVQAQLPQPEIKFVGYEWNVGKFSKKKTPLRGAVYPFTNTGNAPLVINDVVPKCGCLRVDWIKKPIPPGGKGWVKVVYDGRNQLPHYFNKNAVVHTNAPNGQIVWLTLEGDMTD